MPKTACRGYTHPGDIIGLSYEYDEKGNMSRRTDSIGSQYERFRYDEHNRLTNYDVYRNGVLVKESSIGYHPNTGNISSKSDLGNYTLNYGENGKPHALTSISGHPASIASAALNVAYTDFKKIATLSEGNKSYSLSYGVDEQRRKSVYSENGVAKLPRYYLGSYEEEVDASGNVRKLHYISGADGWAAIYIQNRGRDSMLYVFTDHLGSPVTLTDEKLSVIERYAFDPWGLRRDPSDWSRTDTRTTRIIDRGFTGHEHISPFSVIDMNGRVYDPLTAQFFSPDPYVQAPDYWLNYNRYGYCLNNPLLYTDPSGESIVGLGIAMLVGAVMNTMMQGIAGNINNVGELFAAIGIGALAGAVGYGVGGTVAADMGVASFVGGALTGGIIGGCIAAKHGGNFWSGKGAIFEDIVSEISGNQVKIADDVTYSNEYTKTFAKENFNEQLKAVKNLYADGRIPEGRGYRVDGDLVYNSKGNTVRGLTLDLGAGRGSDVYLYKLAFVSKKQLFLTMGHEFLHAEFNYNNLRNKDAQHASIYKWETEQAKLWDFDVKFYEGRY